MVTRVTDFDFDEGILDVGNLRDLTAAERRWYAAAVVAREGLPAGLIGYHQSSRWDCMRAAVATVLQVPLEAVPDLLRDDVAESRTNCVDYDAFCERAFAELSDWAAERNLEMVFSVEVPLDRELWIGIVPLPGHFTNHSLVMHRRSIAFDPAEQWPAPSGYIPKRYSPSDVAYGVTFDPIGRKDKCPTHN